MDRRGFLAKSGAAAGLGILGGPVRSSAAAQGHLADLPEIEWEMPTSWPLDLDTIYGGAKVFAEEVGALTGGKFMITPRAGGELVPGAGGAAERRVAAPTRSATRRPTTTPAWPSGRPSARRCRSGSTPASRTPGSTRAAGWRCCRSCYADKFGVIQFPAGNTGCQMGGWFSNELTSVDDLEGLKMRIPGLGGEVMAGSAWPSS